MRIRLRSNTSGVILISRRSLLDSLWLLVLAGYIFAGTTATPFHGDEAMQITMSRDYFTLFINHNPLALAVNPPYGIDSPEWLRLINGSINLYSIGISLQIAGYGERDLPPLWQWPISYDENVTRGSRPIDGVLFASRSASALFLALSSVCLFGIGWQFNGRLSAYLASGLYTLNPVILLNGRRAMMEGSTLCFGLLAIWVTILICKGRNGWRWWLLLGVVCGLTVASKHSGIVFVVSAWGWIIINRLIRWFSKTAYLKSGWMTSFAKGATCALIMIMVFVGLSPAQWNNPVARFGDLVSERAKLLESQVKAEPSAPTSMGERVTGILTQPYMQPPVYFEAAFWAGAKPIHDEIVRYDHSLWSGWHSGMVLGGALTVLAGAGIFSIVRTRRSWQIGLMVWLGVVTASLLVNPLPWQRYYLALYPTAALLTSLGIATIYAFAVQRRSST